MIVFEGIYMHTGRESHNVIDSNSMVRKLKSVPIMLIN